MTKNLTLFILIVVTTSCEPNVEHLTYYRKYEHKNQIVIRTRGYYFSRDSSQYSGEINNRLFILFDNGTYFGNINTTWPLETFSNFDSLNNIVTRSKNDFYYWGVYKIQDSEIYLRGFYQFHMLEPYLLKGTILNDSTLSFDWIKSSGTEELKENSLGADKYQKIFNYFPSAKPDSTNWILKNRELNK